MTPEKIVKLKILADRLASSDCKYFAVIAEFNDLTEKRIFSTAVYQFIFQQLPDFFPQYWVWSDDGSAQLIGREGDIGSIFSVIDFFELSLNEFVELFTTGYQIKKTKVSAQEVASNIISFIKKHYNGKIPG